MQAESYTNYIDTARYICNRGILGEARLATIKRESGLAQVEDIPYQPHQEKIVVHQPSPAALQILDRMVRDKKAKLVEVHVARDWMTTDRAEAYDLKQCLAFHLDHAYSRKEARWAD